jgi:hypothetical protein
MFCPEAQLQGGLNMRGTQFLMSLHTAGMQTSVQAAGGPGRPGSPGWVAARCSRCMAARSPVHSPVGMLGLRMKSPFQLGCPPAHMPCLTCPHRST